MSRLNVVFGSPYGPNDAFNRLIWQILSVSELLVVRVLDGKVATAPIKSRARALEKIVNDYGGDASSIKDLVRNTVVVSADQIDSVVSALAHNGANIKRINAATDPLGYSGVNSSLKTKNGITGEIQVNSPEMIYAKETPKNARAILGDDVYDSISAKTGIEGGLGHKLYEHWRALPEGNQGRSPIEAQSKAYYDAIRSKAGLSAANSFAQNSAALSPGELLKQKYNQLTPTERKAKLNSLLEVKAYNRLKALESSIPGAHFVEKHGAQTTLPSQLDRVQVARNPTAGVVETWPNGKLKKPSSATRFLTHRDQWNAIQRSQTILKRTGNVDLAERPIKFDNVVGEGYRKDGLQYGQSYSSQVWYKNGQLNTAFPIWGQ